LSIGWSKRRRERKATTAITFSLLRTENVANLKNILKNCRIVIKNDQLTKDRNVHSSQLCQNAETAVLFRVDPPTGENFFGGRGSPNSKDREKFN